MSAVPALMPRRSGPHPPRVVLPSNDYLASLAADFNAARSAGVKVILRFSYTDILTDGAPYGDAEPQRMLRHVEQLTPVVSQHVDVIFVAQAGFVGTWGTPWPRYVALRFGGCVD